MRHDCYSHVVERTRMFIGKSELGRQKSRSQAWIMSCSIVLRCDWRVLFWSDVSSLVCGLFGVLSGLFSRRGFAGPAVQLPLDAEGGRKATN